MESVVENPAVQWEPLDGIATFSGLRIDEVNYVFCMLLSYPLAVFFSLIPTSLVSLRHFLAGFVGMNNMSLL